MSDDPNTDATAPPAAAAAAPPPPAPESTLEAAVATATAQEAAAAAAAVTAEAVAAAIDETATAMQTAEEMDVSAQPVADAAPDTTATIVQMQEPAKQEDQGQGTIPAPVAAPAPVAMSEAAAPAAVANTAAVHMPPQQPHALPQAQVQVQVQEAPQTVQVQTVAIRDRDLLLLNGPEGDGGSHASHRANALLEDLIYTHYLLRKDQTPSGSLTAESPLVQDIVNRIFHFFRYGKRYQLAGLKDVPKSFLKGEGCFYKPGDEIATQAADGTQLSHCVPATDDEAKAYMTNKVLNLFAHPPHPGIVLDPNMAVSQAELDYAIKVINNRTLTEKNTAEVPASGEETPDVAMAIDAETAPNADAAASPTQAPAPPAAGDSAAVAAAAAITAGEVAAAATAPPQPGADAAQPGPSASDIDNKADNSEEGNSSPHPIDVIFLPHEYVLDDAMPFEHQSGNRHFLFLASQMVAGETNHCTKRVPAALHLITSAFATSATNGAPARTPRFIVQQVDHDPHPSKWHAMPAVELAEYATIFAFEIFLEKQIHVLPSHAHLHHHLHHQSPNTVPPPMEPIIRPPSDEPVEAPTPHDVLFGRGGMTNAHVGNRRFRDIIALHRPDYIRATKMDKPNVARRIVRAIRHGDPAGRFLKKGDDSKWYDVGDRCAAEKTSQGLRERSNAEKRQRSALREALRIRKEDVADGTEIAQVKMPKPVPEIVPGIVQGYPNLAYAGGIPLSLSMKDSSQKRAKRKHEDVATGADTNQESLPPNAVDKDGNILVTDYDILCGRGGLTNHHKGNKRFRDIVALHRPDYVRAPKIQKPSVARVIVRAIRNGDPPGRFLKKDEATGKWIDIGDKRAAEKTSQALREKTNDERTQQVGPAPPMLDAATIPKDITISIATAAAEAAVNASHQGRPVLAEDPNHPGGDMKVDVEQATAAAAAAAAAIAAEAATKDKQEDPPAMKVKDQEDPPASKMAMSITEI